MGNKKIIIGLSIALVILLIIGGALAYIYFATDLLKTNAELFAKYGEETTKSIEEFITNGNAKAYYQKKENQNYENDAKFNVKVNLMGNETQEETLLEIKGAVDHNNQKAEKNISLNYSDSQKFSFSLIANGEKYAFGSREVVDKYVVVENSNLKDLAKKLGVTELDQIPDKIDVEQYKNSLTVEQLKELKTKYINVIKQQLKDENFSKEQGENTKYILTVSGQQLKTTIMTIYEELRNEPIILNMLETQDQINKYQDEFDNSIDEIERTDFSDYVAKIIIGKDKTVRIQIGEGQELIALDLAITNPNEITIKTEVTEPSGSISIVGSDEENGVETKITNITLTNQITENECLYRAKISDESSNIIITLDINNMLSSNVEESYKIEVLDGTETQAAMELKNTINFKNVNVTELDNSNSVVFNNLKSEDLQTLVPAIIEEIQKVNGEKIQKVIEETNNGEKKGILGIWLSSYDMMINRVINANNYMDDFNEDDYNPFINSIDDGSFNFEIGE